ncbi:hypothetical protein Prudu_003790 [Prunus dulcis]|uniref:Uncharacterized protein n=1 Tax=Prunus dulcis TaxID=3755 RepID=A0A4Y1QU01_PRUDU|nr:hypothetical protein Prudu_003790 [Prunus dulcis]
MLVKSCGRKLCH